MRVPRLNPSLAIQNLIVVGKITRLSAEKSPRRLGVRLTSECLYQIEMMRPLQCSRPKPFLKLMVSTYLPRLSFFNLLQAITQLIARNP